jgi:Fe-S-cluster containining protein
MSIVDKVRAVEAVYQLLEEETTKFQSRSGLHCLSGCGKCCFKSDIEATVLEFLPFALYAYQQGTAYDWFERLRESAPPVCVLLKAVAEKNDRGLCTQYAGRGLICRLFGFTARLDKHGNKELVTCQLIKSDQADRYEATRAAIQRGEEIPVMSHYYMQLHAVDPELTREFYPINIAIRKALEVVLQYYAYREAE